jgi:hypothetical protein
MEKVEHSQDEYNDREKALDRAIEISVGHVAVETVKSPA